MNDYDLRDTGENAINSPPSNAPRAIAYGVNRLGSRHPSNDTFHLDLHSSSQLNLDPASSTPSPSRQNTNSRNNNITNKNHRLDYYSIPVFLLEAFVLAALGYGAFRIHYGVDFGFRPSGFYCDDNDYKHPPPRKGSIFHYLDYADYEFQCILVVLLSPLAVIVFCELVNSMFGSLKFRKIRSVCACCKLHSITRRTLRITGGFVLGFMLVTIATDLMSCLTARLRPYFGSVCPYVYDQCQYNSSSIPTTQDEQPTVVLRQWIKVKGTVKENGCPDIVGDLAIKHLFTSWPSLPASMFSYVAIYLSYYLCYVGTARPFRMITCVIVAILALFTTMFNVELVKSNYQHWDDVAAGAILAFVVATFVVIVYLNRFKDSHYYEGQKLISSRRCIEDDEGRPVNQFNVNHSLTDKNHNGSPANDIALKYFHIPRANYRDSQLQ